MTLHGLIGWILAAASAIVLVAFGSRYGIVAPDLLRSAGLPLGVAIPLALVALGLWLRSWRVLLLTGLGVVVGAGLGWIGWTLDLWGDMREHAIPLSAYVMAMAGSLAGLLVGVTLITEWAPGEPWGAGEESDDNDSDEDRGGQDHVD